MAAGSLSDNSFTLAVHIDRDLDLKRIVRLDVGTTAAQLRSRLAADAVFARAAPAALRLRAPDGQLLPDGEAIDPAVTEVDVVDAADMFDEEVVQVPAGAPAALADLPASPLPGRAVAALAASAGAAQANETLSWLSWQLRGQSGNLARGHLLLARGLVFWRWSRVERALADLQEAYGLGAAGAGHTLLALQICWSRWPEAKQLAAQLGLPQVVAVVDEWIAGTDAVGKFAPTSAQFVLGDVEIMEGVRQTDGRLPVGGGVELGVRLLLRVDAGGRPLTRGPLVLCFHGNAETVDSYADPEVLRPLRACRASVLVADYRGYGFSVGAEAPSLAFLHVDAERLCDCLPSFLGARGLPWPWPGGLALLGRSLGSRAACHLAGVRGASFTAGVILDSALCGSHAPGAVAPPEPLNDGATGALGGGGRRFSSAELDAAVAGIGAFCRRLLEQVPGLPANLAHFVHVAGNEDKLRGFDGKLLVLHGELDTIVPAAHARRLLDVAEAATRRLVLVPRGHNDLGLHERYAEALAKFFAER